MIQKKRNIVIGNAELPVLLDIFFKEDDEKKPVVIYAHGFNGFKDWGCLQLIAERFATAGFTFIKFNFSHNGTGIKDPAAFINPEAFGQNNYTKQLSDLRLVLDWICDPLNQFAYYIDANDISLTGHSMGGGISILFAHEDNRIKKLITWAAICECKTPWGSWPPERIDEWKRTGVEHYINSRTKQQLPLYYQLYEDYRQHRERLNIKNAISNLSIPVMICHGTEDAAVPVAVAYTLKQWQANAKLYTLPSDHVFGQCQPWQLPTLPEALEKVISENLKFLKSE